MALCLRMSAATWWQSRLADAGGFGFPDSHSYWYLGQRMAGGERYEYGGPDFRIFRAPGYPLLLAGVFAVSGPDAPVLWARALGAVLGTLVVGGVMWLGAMIFDRRTGMIAGALAAVYPGAVGMSILVLAEALFCPLMIGQFICWLWAWRAAGTAARIGWSVAAGVAAGCATLTRPSWLLFTPAVLVLLILFQGNRRRHLGLAATMMLAFSVTMLPWWIRSYAITGHFVATTLQVGASLYDGLNPAATGGSNMSFSTRFYQAQKRDDARLRRTSDGFEVRLDRRLRGAALAWAAEHPGSVFQLMGRKFIRMWNVWPNAAEFRSWRMRMLVAIGYVPLLALGLAGGWKWGRRGWPYVLCILPAIYFTGLHMIFVSSIRYRQPAMIVWVILAAAVLSAGGWRPCRLRCASIH